MTEKPVTDVTGINNQSPLPPRIWDGTYLVHSMFHTIQGEGPFSGDAAVFVRLEGCNLQCPMCDTDYTAGPRAAQMTATEIVSEVSKLFGDGKGTLVVITGGEPFRQDLAGIVYRLMLKSYRVQIETNGTLAPSNSFKQLFQDRFGVAIVVSPKASHVDPWIADHAIAYKYVISHDSVSVEDGLPINVLGRKSREVARPAAPFTAIYVSPADVQEDSINRLNVMATVDSAMTFGHRMQIQIHKVIGLE